MSVCGASQKSFRVLTVFDAQARVGQLSAGCLLDGAHHPRVLETGDDATAHREPRLVLGIEVDANGVVGLALAVEDHVLRRQEGQRQKGGDILFRQDPIEQPMVIGRGHMRGPRKAINESLRDGIDFGCERKCCHLIYPCRRKE